MGTAGNPELQLGRRAQGLFATDERSRPHSSATEFHCTAFGKFHNVSVNPTEQFLRCLPEYLERAPLSPMATIVSATVLETAAGPSLTTLERMYSKVVSGRRVTNFLKASTKNGAQSAVEIPSICPAAVFLHFGVNTTISRFELEMQARNEATFSNPDESGWCPARERIDPDCDLPLEHSRKTGLPVHRLTEILQNLGFDVAVSHDAGRFVCNWVYYHSLRLAERTGNNALFVHVPPSSCQSIDCQLSFFRALVNTVAGFRE